MVRREFWVNRIEAAWERRSVIWLSGVRRVGKTCLCQSLGEKPDRAPLEYFDCDLPRARRQMEDPEGFLGSLPGRRVVLDEIHRLPNPAELLKIAADHFADVRIIATGSSTLQASSKFRDALTGRKTEIWLTSMIGADLRAFGRDDLPHRLLTGGLPPFLLQDAPEESEYQEWLDSYWARDVQELFRVERRGSFLRFVELLLANSGSMFEATKYARQCEVSRATIANYLSLAEATHVAHVVRPYSTRLATEIVSAPKVYGFDTGFVCQVRGWQTLRPEDMGRLWEHYVLNELQALAPKRAIHYWRDKHGHEVDFVLLLRGKVPIAVECKWSAAAADLGNLRSFRHRHPGGENWVVAQDVGRGYTRTHEGLRVSYWGVSDLARRLLGGTDDA
jgi:predicted AAA+ superfamily ATPase